MTSGVDFAPLPFLTRPDKWYLGGANRLIWAPPFPLWLEYPGFWDKAHYYNLEIDPVFTWTLLDDNGREIPLSQLNRSWNPAAIQANYEPRDSHAPQPRTSVRGRKPTKQILSISETKVCLPNDVLSSIITLQNTSREKLKLHLVAWTCQSTHPSTCSNWISDVRYENGKIHFRKNVKSETRPHIRIECAMGLSERPRSYSIDLSEGSVQQPHWKLTPFVEKFERSRLSNEEHLTGVTNDGLLFMGLHASIALKPRSKKTIAVHFTAAPTSVEAASNYYFVRKQTRPQDLAVKSWEEHFAGVPHFECSDEYLTRYYWYRWYGLKFLTMKGPDAHYHHPAVCEGIGYFRAPISYSAMCHIYETRWMHSPELAHGIFRTFLENQREDGGMRGYIDPDYYRQEMFYHANWGRALRALSAVHPDRKFLGEVYGGLTRYAAYFDRERDAEKSGLYDIDNHYETGQEYMHRYTAVDPSADSENWGEVFRMKGVDVTTYIYELKEALASVARDLGRGEDAISWMEGAARIRQAVLEKMWDAKEEMFFDIDPSTGLRTGVKAATCFYPYSTDIAGDVHTHGLKRHLFNRKEFSSPFPFPSSSMDDETFSSTPDWKGKRMNCPWNGRVWPMTNSHLAEALAATSLRSRDSRLRKHTAKFIHSYIKMMFLEGDPERPNCFEHYNPITGAPSIFRGIDDYQHSWVMDLILQYVVGIRPVEGGVVVDPFPFSVDTARARDVVIAGRAYEVERIGRRFQVLIDGKEAASSVIGRPLHFRNDRLL